MGGIDKMQKNYIDITLITVYYITNKERLKWFKISIDSVQKQKGVNIEHIIINDGSLITPPKSWFNHPNITHINREHHGRAIASNYGTGIGIGKYRCNISDDDFLPDEYSLFKRFILAEAHPKASLIWTNGHKIDANGNIKREYINPISMSGIELINRGGIINNTTVIIRRDLWLKIKLNENYTTYEEYDLQIRLAHWSENNGYKFMYFGNIYTGYNRMHGKQGSRNRTPEQLKLFEEIKNNGRKLYGI